MAHEISNTDDLLDIRDVIARVEELESVDGLDEKIENLIEDADASELVMLRELLTECQGNGGDKQYKGDWYPITLIRESYFKDYAQELAEELGAIPDSVTWPCTCIDWDQAARELQMDYTCVDFDGVTYYCR